MAVSTIATNLILFCLAACTLTAATGGWVPLLPALVVALFCTLLAVLLHRAASRMDGMLRDELGAVTVDRQAPAA